MKEFKYALKQSFPIFFTYVFLGIAFGVMMVEAGYSALTTVLCSVFIFAGSMQFVMIPLLKAGAPIITLIIMTLFVNGRHMFYGVGFIDRFRSTGWRYPYMVFSLTDETYSILCSVKHPEGINVKQAEFFIAAQNHFYWILGGFLGAMAGNLLPVDLTGIDFSATAFFLVVVLGQLENFPSKIPAFVGLAASLIFIWVLGPDYFLIPSLSATLIILVLARKVVGKRLEASK